MMTSADLYLGQLLAKYAVDASPGTSRHQTAMQIAAQLQKHWARQHLRSIGFSGSIAKGSANSCANDVDLFIALQPDAPGSLSDIYTSLYNAASAWWPARRQNVSIGVKVNGFDVDLVPGRLQVGYQNWYSLWRNKTKTWCQTNIDNHIKLVSNSGRIEEIRLVKLWRTLHNIEFPSFLLELAVIEALKGRWGGQLANNFSAALIWIANHVESTRFIDPSNSNNVVSDDLTVIEKRELAVAAYSASQQPYYNNIVW